MGMPIPEKLPETADSNLSLARLHERYREIKAEADKSVNTYLDTLQACRDQPMTMVDINPEPHHMLQAISHERLRMSSIASRMLVMASVARSVQMDASAAAALARFDQDGVRQVNENGLTQ